MKKITKIAALLLVAGLAMSSAFADDKGTDIMQKVHDFKKPKFSMTQVIMTLKSKNGDTEVRQIVQYGKDTGSSTFAVMDFKSPASVKDTRFLQIENDNGPDEKHIYLPELKTTRRVSTSEGSQAFMGTDATYDDMTTREMNEDDHQYVKDESFTVANGTSYDCHVVKEVPFDKKSSQYSYRMVWVDKASMYPVHTEMYDKNNKLVKVLEVMKIQNIQGYDIPMEDCLTNVQTGHSTSIKIVNIKIDQPIPDRVFTQSFLSTGK